MENGRGKVGGHLGAFSGREGAVTGAGCGLVSGVGHSSVGDG